MIADRESRVRERAHQIWLDEGCPEGRAEEHWKRAEQDVASSDVPAQAKPQPKPRTQKVPAEKKASAAKKPVEAAAPKPKRTPKAKAPA